MPQIVAVRCKDDSSRDTITVLLSQDAVCLGPDGEPWSGVSLNAQLARSLAQRLLHLAKEIERPEETENRADYSLAQVKSILVLHDGSEQSHRAFRMALDLAARSLASVQLVGLCGLSNGEPEASSAADDYLWQKGWLERLLAMYSQQADQAGVELSTTLVPATDTEELSDICNNNRFDLVVLPRRFSDDDTDPAAFSFRQSLTGATQAGILFCS